MPETTVTYHTYLNGRVFINITEGYDGNISPDKHSR